VEQIRMIGNDLLGFVLFTVIRHHEEVISQQDPRFPQLPLLPSVGLEFAF